MIMFHLNYSKFGLKFKLLTRFEGKNNFFLKGKILSLGKYHMAGASIHISEWKRRS